MPPHFEHKIQDMSASKKGSRKGKPSKDDKQSKVPRTTKAPEPIKYFQMLNHFVGKDLCETFVVDHVFAKNDREIFDFLQDENEEWLQDVNEDNSDEVEEEIKMVIANKGTSVEDVVNHEFYGVGNAWKDMGTVTLDEQATLKKFLGAWVITDGRPERES